MRIENGDDQHINRVLSEKQKHIFHTMSRLSTHILPKLFPMTLTFPYFYGIIYVV